MSQETGTLWVVIESGERTGLVDRSSQYLPTNSPSSSNAVGPSVERRLWRAADISRSKVNISWLSLVI